MAKPTLTGFSSPKYGMELRRARLSGNSEPHEFGPPFSDPTGAVIFPMQGTLSPAVIMSQDLFEDLRYLPT